MKDLLENLSPGQRKLFCILLLLAAAFLSCFVISPIASSPKVQQKYVQELDEKKANVTKMMSTCIVASTAITFAPGDFGTPIANKLSDLSGYFIIILSAIYLERFLIAISGYAVFGWMIPLACIGFAINIAAPIPIFKELGKRLLLFGIVLFLAMPVTMTLSTTIEKSYAASMQAAIDDANASIDEFQNSLNSEEDKNIWDKISDTVTNVTSGAAVYLNKFKTILSNMVDAIAVMLVTSCLLPLLVVLILFGIVKSLFGMDIPMIKPELFRIGKRGPGEHHGPDMKEH